MKFEYGTTNICMEIWVYGFVWNLLSSVWRSIDVCTIVWVCIVLGIKSIDTWFGTLYLVYGLGLDTPNLISC